MNARDFLLSDAGDPGSLFAVQWAVVFLAGGGLLVISGFLTGWLLWGRCRRRADEIDLAHRKALQDYEQRNEELKRLKRKVLYKDF